MKAYRVLGGLVPPILIAALDVGEWSTKVRKYSFFQLTYPEAKL
jgi:hypothetical protein